MPLSKVQTICPGQLTQRKMSLNDMCSLYVPLLICSLSPQTIEIVWENYSKQEGKCAHSNILIIIHIIF